MIGAIMGDMIGAPYEFDRSPKTKEFPLFSNRSEFTDDSVMTVAVAEALMDSMGKTDEEMLLLLRLIKAYQIEWQRTGFHQLKGQLLPDSGHLILGNLFNLRFIVLGDILAGHLPNHPVRSLEAG